MSLNDLIKTANTSKYILKDLKNVFGAGITLTNNEIKGIIKVIKFLENRGILLKKTTKKTASPEGGYLNFLWSLMTAGLLLMESVLNPLAKSAFLPLGLTAAMSATDTAIQKKKSSIRYYSLNNFK